MNKSAVILITIGLFVSTNLLGKGTQTIRGSIKDKDSKFPLGTATVALYKDSTLVTGATADFDGNFRIENVAVGRYTIVGSYVGYQQIVRPDVVVNSGKEVILNLEMEESVIKMKEVEVTATKKKGQVMNEMALVSARAFTVEETERYAGSRGDPARMASNFAGCQGADDSRNDIVVRGNSPLGVLYRVEGVDIPNPNHFAVSGSAGGPVSILNNKVLSNSDFYTGAFPAEFGNSVAGVFDINMRNGNNEQNEFTGQFGFLGTELTAEGPINKEKRSSYLLNYRYSTLALFGGLGINIGTTAIPQYMDGSFKLNFPNKKGSVSLFGIGGKSDIDILISKQKPEDIEIYGETDRDQYFNTSMGIAGLKYVRTINKSTYMKITLAQSFENQKTHHEYVYRQKDSLNVPVLSDGNYVVDSLVDILNYNFRQARTSFAFSINKKFGPKHVIKLGSNTDMLQFNMIDSIYFLSTYVWDKRWDYQGMAFLIQPYIQWKWKMSDKFVINMGIHSQFFTLNGSASPAEPRVGIRFSPNNKNTFSAGFGMHSQLQPMYTYFYQLPDSVVECGCQESIDGKIMHNLDMGFTRSDHYVVGYERQLGSNARLRIEAHYQKLKEIPITEKPSSFSLVNMGSGFSRFFPEKLTNSGTGENKGVELTLEKFFSKKYFFMVTGSFYESMYKGRDGVERHTDFDGTYALNVLAAKEFKMGDRSCMTLGVKFTQAGNKRYGPVDTLQSALIGEIVYVDAYRNSYQFGDYQRLDVKVNYKINGKKKKVTHEMGIDLVNILGNQNVLKLSYAPDPNNPLADPVREEYQLGFLPIFYYKIDF